MSRIFIYYLPDVLTTVRLILVPFVFVSIGKSLIFTIILLSIVFITDILDGYIARSFKISDREFGKAYDHLVDKLLVLVIVYALVIYKNLPNWAFIFFLIREFLIIIGALFLWFYKVKIEGSNLFGKIAGSIFYAMVIAYIFELKFRFELLVLSIIASILAFIIYVIRSLKNVKSSVYNRL